MEKLYHNLLALCDNADTPFYFAETEFVGEDYLEHYRIFSYHFTDRDSWMLPDALEARGIMFEVTDTGEFIRIAARPMQKFFNKGEVDFIVYSDPKHVMNKADGSLISSWLAADGELRLKSKTSIHSDYAMLAMDLLDTDAMLVEWILQAEEAGYTVNMELVSPDPQFRIVIHYPEPQLFVLNARHRETGEYMDYNKIPADRFAGTVDHDVLNHLDTATCIEGYVIVDEHDNWWKEKCSWYLERHRAKDFVNQPNAFVELVLKDEADDVFALLEDQPLVLMEMQNLQHRVITYANTLINKVTAYYNENKELTRKDYAIKGKEELTHQEFVLAMRYYTGTEPNWKGQLLQWVKKIDWVGDDD